MIEQLQRTWESAVAIWIAGGWAMIGIAAGSMVMFGLGVHVWLRLTAKRFTMIRERTWRRWIEDPAERRGPVGELLDFVSGARTLEDLAAAFSELRTTEVAPFERDLKVMRICVTLAPLLGLLGTVTGMLVTFNALATGSGGEKTMGLIAAGISEALITTETGLVIALPGMFFHYQLARKFDRYKAFLAHLETVCSQYLHARRRKAAA